VILQMKDDFVWVRSDGLDEATAKQIGKKLGTWGTATTQPEGWMIYWGHALSLGNSHQNLEFVLARR